MIKQGKAKLLYLAAEALLRAYLLELLATVEVDCLAVDEAHCISQWDHDFRPEYRRLIEARDRFPNAFTLAGHPENVASTRILDMIINHQLFLPFHLSNIGDIINVRPWFSKP